MSVIINGDTGISGVDGSAAAPSFQGTDTNTGIFYPAADTVAFGTSGSEAMRLTSTGAVSFGSSGTAYGTSGQYLQSNGNTTPTWTSITSSQWTTTGSDIYYNTGNVGIGTTSPSGAGKTLAVQGDYSSIVAGSTSNANFVSFYSGQTVDPNPSIIFNNSLRFGTATDPNTAGYTERMRITDTGLLQFNSGYGSVATAYGCRAWVNFNGTGTVAIRASGNVTSITDNATGQYTVNFTNAMPNANYSVSGGASSSNCEAVIRMVNYQTGTVGVQIVDSNVPAFTDDSLISVSIIR